MSDVNPILSGSAQSIAAYQDAIEQSTQAVVEWLKQPEMYQGKTVEQLRERINLNFTSQGLGNQPPLSVRLNTFSKTACWFTMLSAWRTCTAQVW